MAQQGTLTALEKEIAGRMDAQQERLIDLLATLVRFPTDNPPGHNEGPAQEWMAQRMRQLGAAVDVFDALPGRPDVVGTVRGAGGGPSVILNGHIDVAEVRQPDAWQRPPFQPVIEGRLMYGRGTSDMKSALAAYLFALEQLQALGMKLRGDVIVQSVMGEEAAEPGTRVAAQRYRADFAIVGEATQTRQMVATVGVLTGRITIQSPYTLHLHARRLALHAGGGVEGANAIEKMSLRIIPALNDLEREWAVFKRHPLIPPAQTLINVFQVAGGGNPGFMPDQCSADLVMLYLPGEEKEAVQREVEDQVRRAAEADGWLRKYPPRIQWGHSEHLLEWPPADLDVGHGAVQALMASHHLVQGQEPQVGGRGAITDAGWLAVNGTAAVVYGPGDFYWIHRLDERVNLDDVLSYAKVLGVFLTRWCGVAA
ncbi:MAG: ArgE/DapE family deacylase [Dehalococcoidia bacterium]